MKPRLIILSDLWGREKAQWVFHYQNELKKIFDIKYYDCCELAEINKSIYTKDKLHQQFVHGGIETASKNLAVLETKNVTILAFSIGGTIAWKAILNNLKFDLFYAISATRLRYQTSPIDGNVQLYFGAEDPYKPSKKWLYDMQLDYKILKNQGHLIYTNLTFTQDLCTDILYKYSDLKQSK